MSLSTIAMLGRAILLMISFVGLCAAVRTQLKVNRFIAPFAVCCSIITLLMFAGMLRVLAPMFYLIYAAGFAGFIYAYFIRREKPEYGLIAALVIFIAFLVWRFYFCPLYRNDDISHWGLVARHLLKCDAFPDKDTGYVFFQSYPLGAASFIYYIGKTIANTEGIYLVAQELLQGLLFLPVLAHIRENRRQCYCAATALFLLLFSYFRNMVNLQVDLLLAFFGIGMAASTIHYRDNFKKALPIALLGMIAVVYVKNSGLFFAFATALLLGYAAHRCTKKRSAVWLTVLLTLGAAVIAYLLWVLHIRISYPAALDTKHAVSLSAYAAQAESKGFSVIAQICAVYLRTLFSPSFPQACVLAFMAGCAGMMVYGLKKLPAADFSMKKLGGCLGICIGVYALWAVMVLGMYIFSMPTDEALGAASFYRYNGTGTGYMMGLTGILFFNLMSRRNARALPGMRLLQIASLAFVLCFAVMCCMDLTGVPFAGRIFERNTSLSMPRKGLVAAHAEYALPQEGTYLVYCRGDDPSIGPFNEYYHVKYEFETTNIHMIAEKDGLYLAGTREVQDYYTDIIPFLREVIDQCDAMLVMDESPAFQAQLSAFLESYEGDTPVIYTYEY